MSVKDDGYYDSHTSQDETPDEKRKRKNEAIKKAQIKNER